MKTKLLAALATALLSSSCTIGGYIGMNEVLGSGKTISAERSYTMFLGFFHEPDAIHELQDDLERKCKGKVTGVTTMVDVTWYLIVTTFTMRGEATCKGKSKD